MDRLKNICETIFKKRKEHRPLEEKQVFICFEGILDAMYENQDEEAYQKLSDMVHEMWQYRRLQEIDIEQAFLYGSLWGAINLEELNRKRMDKDRSLNHMVTSFRNYFPILAAIHGEPGITHKKLADIQNKTASDMSQIISRIYDERVFTYSRTGREKNYYLGYYGEQVYQRLKKENEQETTIVFRNNTRNAMSVFEDKRALPLLDRSPLRVGSLLLYTLDNATSDYNMNVYEILSNYRSFINTCALKYNKEITSNAEKKEIIYG